MDRLKILTKTLKTIRNTTDHCIDVLNATDKPIKGDLQTLKTLIDECVAVENDFLNSKNVRVILYGKVIYEDKIDLSKSVVDDILTITTADGKRSYKIRDKEEYEDFMNLTVTEILL